MLALAGALLFLPLAAGGLLMWGLTHVGCARSGSPDQFGLAYEDVRFTTPQGRSIDGYFLPGSNGGTVIVAPSLANDRGGDLADAAIFNRAGFHVLTFDSPTCAGAPVHSLGYLEAGDAEAAFHYLASRPDVDASRVSIHGFSSAGAASLFAAARRPELRAVSAKGGYHDLPVLLGVGRDQGFFMSLIAAGGRLGYRLSTGLDIEVLRPVDVMQAIAPRPVLLIYGSREVSLPGARQMLERATAAGVPAELWVVEGAGHGNYHAVAGETYERRLTDFHRRAFDIPDI
ncbi:MAG: prolyl oligopeptidase family serine peptidase [Chloroflexota bacterium]